MYVEITGRQTGKSTRMVDDIATFLEENGNKTALVVSPTVHSRKLIKEKIFNKCGYCVNRVVTSNKMLPVADTIKQYVDEFFCVRESDLVVDKNAYYCGTPKNDGLYGIYELIYETFQLQTNGNMIPIKPLRRHGFGGNN